MNKIALISPLPQGHRAKFWEDYFNRLKANDAIRPDTQISVRTISKHTSKGRISANTLYFELLQRQYTVEAVLDAQKEGFDAVIDSCYFDPALDEAREVADIPVVGLAEASFSYSLLLGRKKGSTAVIAVAEKGISKTWDVLDKYGLTSHLIANRPVRQVPDETYFGAVASGD
ncbi:MAG: aspartate/glutamate racemase family protein, partial [Chloroflexota bacterium]